MKMETAENIITIGTLLTALGVIMAAVVKLYRFIRKWEKWVEEQSEHALDNYLSIKRLTIMSHEMPLSERIAAVMINHQMNKVYYNLFFF